MDNVADVGKLPARRSRRPRMTRILLTSSGSNQRLMATGQPSLVPFQDVLVRTRQMGQRHNF